MSLIRQYLNFNNKFMSNNINIISLPETGFVRLPLILKIFPIGRSTWWQGVKDGKYPKPVKLGQRTTAWKVEDIKDLIDQYSK
jgi:predicted DNA-binding transcriptional regulator AlpA